jgi:hypothetical protein
VCAHSCRCTRCGARFAGALCALCACTSDARACSESKRGASLLSRSSGGASSDAFASAAAAVAAEAAGGGTGVVSSASASADGAGVSAGDDESPEALVVRFAMSQVRVLMCVRACVRL